MALNSFFLQGSQGEQRLLQDLINEQLSMYGVEVLYLPRKLINTDNIFREVESSAFNDNFAIEAYVNTYEGYTGAGDIMTKFGMSLKDDLVVTISKERFEDFISAFLLTMPEGEINVATRPREGDLIYFPLGQRMFEIKFVEHEKPFYQLQKNYVYELQCELFELEDEVGGWDEASTGIEEVDNSVLEYGYTTELQLISIGSTATLGVTTTSGYIRNIFLNDDGSGYTEVPTVAITTAPSGGVDAKAVAITTHVDNIYSVKEILLTQPGFGYTVAPTVTIVSTATTATNGLTTYHGVGAAATARLVTDGIGISTVTIVDQGSGYVNTPELYFASPTAAAGIVTASGRIVVGASNTVSEILIADAGIGYTVGTGIATVGSPHLITGIGTYQFNEQVIGSVTGAIGRVKSWYKDTGILKLGTTEGEFGGGEIAVGSTSGAQYSIDYIKSAEFADKYDQNEIIESEADSIIDFSESNPFGQV